MNRLAGIIIAVFGLIIAVLSYTRVIYGLTGTGIILILFGALIIGLSFVPKPEAGDTPKMSTPETLAKIFYAPSEVFQNLRRHPRWLVAMLIVSILSAAYTNAFIYRLGSDKVVNYAIDKTKEMSFLDDKGREQIESNRATSLADNKNPVLRTAQAVSSFVGSVFWIAFLALLFFLFILALGGRINYWQAFAAATYTMFAVGLIRYILSAIILFVKDPTDIHPLMGQSTLVQDNLSFLTTPATHPVLYTLLSIIGILSFYWIYLTKTGLNEAGEKVTSTMAWTAVLGVWFLGVMLALLMAMIFPSFMS